MKYFIAIFISLIAYGNVIKGQTVTIDMLKAPCNSDGILKANFQGIPPPFTISWNYNGIYKTIQNFTGTTDTIFDFAGGDAYVYAYSQGATAYGTFNTKLPFEIGVNTQINTCPTPSIVQITTTGGTAPFSFEWFNTSNGGNFVGNSNPINLTDGSYQVIVTDAAGCKLNNQQSQKDSSYIYIYSPPNFEYEALTVDANCVNGSAYIANISGGKAPFTYNWSNGSNASSINNLVSGNYAVTVTDSDGCSNSHPEVYVNQAIQIPVNITSSPESCANVDGAAIAFAAGGQPPYSYTWSIGANTQGITNVSSGSYYVEAIDANGCRGQGYTYISGSSPVYVTVNSTTPSSCTAPTGTAQILPQGGLPPYTITWNTFPTQNGPNLSNVPSGNYTFSVTDANGCSRTGIAIVSPESILVPSISVTAAECLAANGGLIAGLSGGVAPYTYNWSNGVNQPINDNLTSGGYTVTLTDSKSCSIVKYVYVPSSSPLSIGFATTDASCIFSSDGTITANITGGNAPYSYSWSNAASAPFISGLSKGLYYVQGTDANGCIINSNTYVSYDPTNDNCYCKIEGTVFHDINQNCIKDIGEAGIHHIQIHCSGRGYTYTNASGYYSFIVPSGTYTVSESIQTQYPLSPCQSKSVQVTKVAATGCIDEIDFANKINPIRDIIIGLWPDNHPVPGFDFEQNMIITNAGTITESDIIASYLTDNQIGVPTILPATIFDPTPTNGYFTSANALMPTPGASETVKLNYLVPTNIPLSTELTFKDSTAYQAPIANWLTDYTPWNNVNYRNETVVGSFDPNFIEVSPQGFTQEGIISKTDSVLQYMVHFENLGNYFATNIVVKCALSEKLTPSTLMPIYASNDAKVEVAEDGMVTYTFDNIHLYPKAWGNGLSTGYFVFSVHAKPGLQPLDKIFSLADIYFDFNEPIRTNTAVNTIEKKLSTDPVPLGIVNNVYPNPANAEIKIELSDSMKDEGNIEIFDLYGRIVMNKAFNTANSGHVLTISTNDMVSGFYVIVVSSPGQKTQTFKQIVIKED